MAELKWTQYIPHDPFSKQIEALQYEGKDLLYGGALGGGKSDYLLMAALQYVDIPGFAAIILRKQLSDLKLPGALLDRAREWLGPFVRSASKRNRPVTYIPSEHTYQFDTFYPDGTPGEPAKLVFGYVGDANAKDRYQSAEFQYVAFDEAGHWQSPADVKFLTTRLRKTVCKKHGKLPDGKPNYVDDCVECQYKKIIPLRLRLACNPGGLGGPWLMKRYGIIPDPELYPDRRDALDAIAKGVRVPFVGSVKGNRFLPSLIYDNPYLDLNAYDEFLEDLDHYQRSMLRDGNWLGRIDARFKRQYIKYYDLHDDMYQLGRTYHSHSSFSRIFATADLAGTVKEGLVDQEIPGERAESHTVISVWGVDDQSRLFWLDMIRFRDEIPEVVSSVVNMFIRWKPKYVCMEDNGVGLGVVQLVKRTGIPVKAIHKKKDKLENSTAAQTFVKQGMLYLPRSAPWVEECEDELFVWSGNPVESDDIIDTLSDAVNDIAPGREILTAEQEKEITQTFMEPRPVTPKMLAPQLRPRAAKARAPYKPVSY